MNDDYSFQKTQHLHVIKFNIYSVSAVFGQKSGGITNIDENECNLYISKRTK